MAYAPQSWHDRPATDTPIDADRLAHIESGVVAVDAAITAAVPSAVIEAAPLICYGNSYLQNTGNALTIYYERLKRRIGSALTFNFGSSGMLAPDACAHAYGSFTAQHDAGTAAGTWGVQALVGGVVILDVVRNDAGYDGVTASGGTTAKSRAGFANALDALIRLVRAQTKTEDTAAGWAYTGTWAAITANNTFSGGTAHYTSTPGDKATISVTGTDFDLIVIALDASGAGVNGPTYAVKVDGVSFTTGTTNNQTRKTGHTPPNTGYCQMAIPIRSLTAGAHTIELSHTGSALQYLYIDTILVPTPTPPTVLIPKCPQLSTAGYATYIAGGGVGASWAVDQVYNGLIDTVAARFGTDQSVIAWDPNAYGWDPATMIGNTDGASVHLNDKGNDFYADGIMATLNALPGRAGLVRL